jgi:ADP-ribose pyrophosphatase YjhB (NUDIX family)
MTRIVRGERISRQAILTAGCSAILFDASRQKILLTRRTDNGLWCLPGGRMEPGESAAEACEREVWEETGLQVRAARLIGVYSDPNMLIEYADGNRCQILALSFEAEIMGGELGLSDETTEAGYFTLDEIESMELMEHHRQRIVDALSSQPAAFIR